MVVGLFQIIKIFKELYFLMIIRTRAAAKPSLISRIAITKSLIAIIYCDAIFKVIILTKVLSCETNQRCLDCIKDAYESVLG